MHAVMVASLAHVWVSMLKRAVVSWGQAQGNAVLVHIFAWGS